MSQFLYLVLYVNWNIFNSLVTQKFLTMRTRSAGTTNIKADICSLWGQCSECQRRRWWPGPGMLAGLCVMSLWLTCYTSSTTDHLSSALTPLLPENPGYLLVSRVQVLMFILTMLTCHHGRLRYWVSRPGHWEHHLSVGGSVMLTCPQLCILVTSLWSIPMSGSIVQKLKNLIQISVLW